MYGLFECEELMCSSIMYRTIRRRCTVVKLTLIKNVEVHPVRHHRSYQSAQHCDSYPMRQDEYEKQSK